MKNCPQGYIELDKQRYDEPSWYSNRERVSWQIGSMLWQRQQKGEMLTEAEMLLLESLKLEYNI